MTVDYKMLIKKINRSQALLDSMYERIAEKHALTFNALMIIYIMAEESDVTQKLICEEVYLPKSTVHSIVMDFMKKGLIVFEDKRIGREKVLSFTEEGVAFSEMIMSEIASEEKSILKYLGKEDCEKLAAISDRLLFYFEGKVGGQIDKA